MRRQCRCSSGNGPSPCSTRPATWSNWTRSQALQLLPHPLPAGRRLAGLRWPEWTRAGCQGCRACPSWQWGSEDVFKNAEYYLTRQTFKAKNHQPGNSPKLRRAQARNVPDDVAVAKAGIDLALNLGHGQTQWLLTVEVAQHLLAVGAPLWRSASFHEPISHWTSATQTAWKLPWRAWGQRSAGLPQPPQHLRQAQSNEPWLEWPSFVLLHVSLELPHELLQLTLCDFRCPRHALSEWGPTLALQHMWDF